MQQTENSIRNEQKIKDLGIFTMLSLLRIDVNDRQLFKCQGKDFDKLKSMVNNSQITAINSIVFLAMQEVLPKDCLGLSPKMKDDIIHSHFMIEIENLTGCLVMNESGEDLLSMQGEFLKMLKAFFNLIFEPVLQANSMKQEINMVKDLTISDLVKSPAILKDLWSVIDSKRRGVNQ